MCHILPRYFQDRHNHTATGVTIRRVTSTFPNDYPLLTPVMTIEEFTTLFDSYKGRGYTGDKAHGKAFDAYVSLQYSRQSVSGDTRSRNELSTDAQDLYYECRQKGYSTIDAWKRCERHISRKIDDQRVHASPFDDFSDILGSLPDHGGHKVYEANHRGRGNKHDQPHYRTEYRTPDGGPWFHQTDEQHAGRPRHYQTEERQPGGRPQASRGSPYTPSYRTEERTPNGDTFKYTTSSYYYTASSSPHTSSTRGPSRSSRPSYHTEERTPSGSAKGYSSYPFPPQSGGRTGPSRSYYTTEERTPGGSSGDYTSRSPSPPPSSRPSYTSRGGSYDSNPRSRPRTSPPPPPRGNKPSTCFYTVLEISRSASVDEIKKAHRKLSMKWHPDRCVIADKSRATAKMAEINQANDVLSDAKSKAYYDKTGCVL
jgi:curved DNA-binding protein CbpA